MVSRQPNRKLYRTMQGRMVDIEKLRATNEEVRAVGNMNVNARGDVVGTGGKIVKTKEQLMKDHLNWGRGIPFTPYRRALLSHPHIYDTMGAVPNYQWNP